ncbi:glycosyltransferase family 2 protein [Roseomonas eburnea]|uniref:Glycosyltransferase family 2 protein n=1 Tax=Neoroseomonas eburnea TaxID=1346889 RepID=A0A9X9X5S7_9PROT|nr:glycosyltransferase family 2 protein [Neoroseomonas eburnea]MBR0679063.1 glycosyltransferase family 2 protein [Neoroseomonas eburnea]
MLSIAICTHDRSADVRICLEHLHPQIDFAAAELLIIDSGCSAAEASALARATEAFPGARLIRIAVPGLSRARNAAVGAARGEWVAFLDDDAVPEAGWFGHAMRLVAAAPDRCGIIGGTVLPLFPEGSDPRIGRRWRQYLSLVEQPDEALLAADVSVCGANAIYRRACLADCGGFPESLGRVGTRLLSGEEKLVQEIAMRRGWTAARSHLLRAGHRIPVDRLGRDWAARRAYWDGLSDERISFLIGPRTTGTEAAALAARAAILGLLYPIAPAGQEFDLRFWYAIGRLREWLNGPPRQTAGSDDPVIAVAVPAGREAGGKLR